MQKIISLAFCATSYITLAATLKIATIIPEDPGPGRHLIAMAKEISQASSGRVELKFIFGGAGGDEPDVMRKIRTGQLQGGIFTAKELGEIVGDIRVLEVPFTFTSRDQAKATLFSIKDKIAAKFAEKNFIDLGVYEFGEIFMVTKDKIASIDDLSGKKLWIIPQDKLAEAFTTSLKLAPVTVSPPDVLTSLNTDLITVAYAPAIGIIGLQWHTKIKYIIEPSFAFHFQGLIVDSKSFNKLSSEDQKLVKDIASKYVPLISDSNIEDAKKARDLILKQGVTLLTWPEKDITKVKAVREDVLRQLTGNLLSADIIKEVNLKTHTSQTEQTKGTQK